MYLELAVFLLEGLSVVLHFQSEAHTLVFALLQVEVVLLRFAVVSEIESGGFVDFAAVTVAVVADIVAVAAVDTAGFVVADTSFAVAVVPSGSLGPAVISVFVVSGVTQMDEEVGMSVWYFQAHLH